MVDVALIVVLLVVAVVVEGAGSASGRGSTNTCDKCLGSFTQEPNKKPSGPQTYVIKSGYLGQHLKDLTPKSPMILGRRRH